MTISNIWVGADRALVATDTVAGLPGNLAPWEVSKMIPLVHANAILAVCGNAGLMHKALFQILSNGGDFDRCADVLATTIDRCFDDLLSDMQNAGLKVEVEGVSTLAPYQSVSLVGWSTAHDSMRGEYQARGPGDRKFSTRNVISPYVLHPDCGETSFPPSPDSLDKMLGHAAKQLAWWQRTVPKIPTGGRLLVAELTRDTMQITSHPL